MTEAIFSFPKCHSLQGNSFLSLGFARTPCDFDWLFFQTKLSRDPRPPTRAPLEVGPGSLNQVLQLTHVSHKCQRPHPSSWWTLQSIPSPFKSLELLFFAASKNITSWFFQVSSKPVYLNRTSFFNGYQERLVRYRQSLNYSYVCKEHILKLSNEMQTSEQQLICCSGPFGGLHGPQSLGRQEPCPVCAPEPSWCVLSSQEANVNLSCQSCRSSLSLFFS